MLKVRSATDLGKIGLALAAKMTEVDGRYDTSHKGLQECRIERLEIEENKETHKRFVRNLCNGWKRIAIKRQQ